MNDITEAAAVARTALSAFRSYAAAVRQRLPLRLAWAMAICIVLWIGAGLSRAQEYSLKTWTVENGLPQNIIRGIAQTPDGYLWLATLNGMARFDGVRFVVFDKSNTPGIATSRFTSMVMDKYGDLWMVTDGRGLTRYHDGTFRSYGPEDGIPMSSVRGIELDHGGNVWVLAEENILRFDQKSEAFVEAAMAIPTIHYEPLRWGGGFWGREQSGLAVIVGSRVIHYPLPSWFSPATVWDAGVDPNGGLWLESYDGHQVYAAPNNLSIKRMPPDAPHTISYRTASGQSWTEHVGFHLGRYLDFTSSGKRISVEFRTFFEDREGNAWIGTEGDGLSELQKQVIHVYSTRDGLAGQNIYPVYQDRAGTIWMGAWPVGLSALRGGRFTNYTTASGLPGRLVTAIGEDSENRIWVGAHGGLSIFLNGRFEPARVQLPRDAVAQAILEDHGGTMWIGTTNGLVVYRNGPSRTITVGDGLAGNDVKVIIEGQGGKLWIGGYGGLTEMRGGQFTHWTEHEGLPSNNIRALYEDAQGVLWIGSYDGGLARFKDGKFTHYDERIGLSNNGVFQILEDNHQNLWMSSNRGIYSVSKRDLNDYADGRRSRITCIKYGRADGMLNMECNGGMSPAGIRAHNGTLWFPTQDGVAVLNPDDIHLNPQPPPVVIESAFVDRVPADISKELTIQPGKENIELEYTALSFIHSDEILFRYKLEGLDSNWVDAGSRRTAYYSHLPPGQYTFHVIAANSDGVWNNNGQSLAVTVLTPFYKTWWFLSIEGVIAASLITLAIYLRLRQLRQEQLVQKAFSQQLIASQEKERQRIAAELHDSIGQRLIIINNLAQLYIKAHRKQSSFDATAIEEITDEISHAIRETREISYNLRPFQLDRLGLTKAVEIVLRTVGTSSGLQVTSELDNIDEAFPKDLRINFYRIVQEAMNNIMKHAQATEVHVRVQHDARRVLLSIRDNGVGFAPAHRQSKSSKGGFGLTGMDERAHSLGGSLRVSSAPGQGTIMTVEFPVSPVVEQTAPRPIGE